MPVHDWTRVPAGIFHAFHNAWITRLQDVLNGGRMPEGYYALGEQSMREEDDGADGRSFGPDVLALQIDGFGEDSVPPPPGWTPDESDGGIAVAEAPPKVAQRRTMSEDMRFALRRRRSIAVRHVSGDRLVALVEIVSPGNKHELREIERFADKIQAAIEAGVHVLMIDLFPPTPRDPDGLHGLIGGRFGDNYISDPATPLTLASYVADRPPVAYVEPFALGRELPEMPLFLDPRHYFNVPLGETYTATFEPFPLKYRRQLEA